MMLLDFIAQHPLLAAILAVVVLLSIASVRIANQYERAVVFRLGKFDRIAGPGLHFLAPFVEWQDKVDLRTMTANVLSST
jgi:regulator of protease activity HflC (stomatin/prohibitin superfamily)